MNTVCKDFVSYILDIAPRHNKEEVENDACERFHLTKDRKVYHNDYLLSDSVILSPLPVLLVIRSCLFLL